MKAIVNIQDIYKITGIGYIPAGTIKSGTLKVGMHTIQNGNALIVKTIEMHHTNVLEANEGDNIGFNLSGDSASINSLKGLDVTFMDGPNPSNNYGAPEPIRPKGFLDSILSIFKKK